MGPKLGSGISIYQGAAVTPCRGGFTNKKDNFQFNKGATVTPCRGAAQTRKIMFN